MNTNSGLPARRRALSAFTLVEVMIATALASMILGCVGSLAIFGTRSSIALLNYTDLDGKSRYAADVISRAVRNAYSVSAFQTNLPRRSISLLTLDPIPTDPTLFVTNLATITWDADARTLTLTRSDQAPFTALTECDRWDFSLYQRTPIVTKTNLLFFPATNTVGLIDPSLCKLVNMSWKCSRTILAQKVNTESVQAAQIVLRNKP